MLSEAWQLGLSSAVVIVCALFSLRQVLGWRALRGLRSLARHSHTLQNQLALVGRIPDAQLSPEIRHAVGKILWHHLGCADKHRPGHPYLTAQGVKITWFTGQQSSTRKPRGRAGADTLAALYELEGVLSDGLEGGAIDNIEHLRAVNALAASAATLETQLLERKAQSATHLRREDQALAYLRSALRSASRIPQGEDEQRKISRRIESLESAI